MKRIFTISILVIAQILSGYSQTITIKVFPTTSDEEFLKDYITVSSANSNTSCKTEVDKLATLFPSFSASEKALLMSLANEMLTAKAKPFPTFLNLNKAVNKILESEDKKHLTEHLQAIKWVLNNSTGNIIKKVEDYCEFSEALATNGYLYASSSRNVKLEKFDYTYKIEAKGPTISFTNNRFLHFTKGDTIDLNNIAASFTPLDNLLKVSSAETNFTKLGYKKEDVFIKLFNFEMDLTKTDFKADSSILTFKPYLDKPVKGVFEDKLLIVRPKSNLSYPQFISKEKTTINKFSPEITFIGSLQIIGDRLYVGSTNNELTSYIKIASPTKAYVTALAPKFMIINYNEIISDQSSPSIFIDGDSISHPLCEFRYLIDKRELTLTKTDKGAGKAPFASTFHQMNIYSDKISWNIDSSNLFLKPISSLTQKPTVIESFDFYEKGAEMKFQNPNGTNPLVILNQMSKSYGVQNLVIPAADLASSLGGYNLDVKSIENMLYKLTEAGFIVYNGLDQTIRILDKTNLYIDASKKETDFDNMRFQSNNSSENGKLSIKNKTIDFKGIKELSLSDSKEVYAFPRNSSLSIGENRSMDFNGEVQAGNVLFIGKDIEFNYEEFKISFKKLDSLIIFVPSNKPDAQGKTPDVALKTVISDISGDLFIDNPDNKSSRNNYEEFPYFVSKDTAYIYYENASHANRKYTKDKFKFAINPFKFENLDEFKYKDISFPGTLTAPEIIEPIKANLIVMSDISLGFEKEIASPGAKMYNKNAFFSKTLKLSNDGLVGNGVLKYEDAQMTSPSFFFFPDSVFAVLNDFKTVKNLITNSPQTTIDSAYLQWAPSKDSLTISRLGNAFKMYDNKATYHGDLIFKKNNTINGIGKLEWEKGKVVSNLYNFKADELLANKAKIEIQSSDSLINSVVSNNADVKVNFLTNQCEVHVVNDSSYTDLDFVKLQTNVSKYIWDMTSKKVTFLKDPNKSEYFLSLNPKFDSLKFEAKEAVYSLEANNLFAKGITGLYVADSKVIPEEGKLMVEAGGDIGSMQNATIILNAEKEFHKIEDVNVDIESSKKLVGAGVFQYTNSFGKKTKINIESIGVKVDTLIDSKGKKGVVETYNYSTYAIGKIYEEENFMFEDILYFKGDVLMSSTSEDIDFEGYAKLDINSAEYVDWFKLDQQINPDNLEIKLKDLENDKKQAIISGLLVNSSSQYLYPAILRAKETSQDVAVYEASGVMKSSKEKNKYLFGEEAVLDGKEPYGSMMTYDDDLQTIEATGKINLVGKLRKIDVEAYGDLKYFSATNKTDIQAATLGIDFLMEPVIWTKLAEDIKKNNETTLSLTYKRNKSIKQALYNWNSDKTLADEAIRSIEQDNYIKLLPTFPYKFLLTDINLFWDEVDGTLKGSDKVGLVSLNNIMVEQKIKCDIEVSYVRGSAEIKILLTTTSGVWYFFHIRNGNVGILSSDDDWNNVIRNSSKNNIVSKVDGTIYECVVANKSVKANFDYALEDYKFRIKELQQK